MAESAETGSPASGRIVLVRTEVPGNLGATARLMRNFGWNDLVLVDPVARPEDREARRLSTHGESILRSCRQVANLSDALADCVWVLATSARTGGLFRNQSVAEPERALAHAAQIMARGRVALVFGPEPSGLTNAEIALCHQLIRIPTAEEYSALNLSHAVAICLYELQCHRATDARNPQPALASFAAQDAAFSHLRAGLEAIHFLYGDKADALMHAVRHLLGRAQPTDMEIGLIHGLARQMEWIGSRAHKSTSESDCSAENPSV